jgi:CheY-like chemotaxis protein
MPKKILVVDDEEILTVTFVKLLETAGYGVLVASRGEDAVVMAEEDDFDLIICDIRMPGQDGVKTIQQIRNIRGKKEVPVIFVTGYADEALEKEANRLGPLAYIYKPFDAFKLLDLIKKAVSK